MLSVIWFCAIIGGLIGWAVPAFTLIWGIGIGFVIGLLICLTAKSGGRGGSPGYMDFGFDGGDGGGGD